MTREMESDCRSGWLVVTDDFSASLTSPEQLKYALQRVGRSPSDKATSRYWTQCGSSGMSYQQFCAVMRREKRTSEADVMQAFRAIDTSGDGYITAHELRRILTKRGERMSQEEVQLIIDEADSNGDGRLDYAEFCQMILSQADESVAALRERGRTKEQRQIQEGSACGVLTTVSCGDSEIIRVDAPEKSGAFLLAQEHEKRVREEGETMSRRTEAGIGEGSSFPQAGERGGDSGHQRGESGSSGDVSVEASSSVRPAQTVSEEDEEMKQTEELCCEVTERVDGGETVKGERLGEGGREREGEGEEIIREEDQDGEGEEGEGERKREGEEGRRGEIEGSKNSGEREVVLDKDVHQSGSGEEERTLAEEVGRGMVGGSQRGEGGGGEEGGRSRLPDHLSGETPQKTVQGKRGPPGSAFPPPPRRPKNLQTWSSIFGKGCFYLDTSGDRRDQPLIRAHHYYLTLPSPTHVWIEVGVAPPGNPATDVQVFVFQTDEDEKLTDFVTYAQHKLDQRCVCRMGLDPGCYALVPFSSGCVLKPRDEQGRGESALGNRADSPTALVQGSGDTLQLTDEARTALQEVFHRMDLDSNGALSRAEFDFFQELSSGEMCDDNTWTSIRENFPMTPEDELPLEGFMQLHVMSAQDEEGGGEEELWNTLTALGYNSHLVLDQACPFELEVFTDSCEGEIEIVNILNSDPYVSSAMCCVAVERGVCEGVSGEGKHLFVYAYTTPHLATIAVENQGGEDVSVELDVRGSQNIATNRPTGTHTVHLHPHSMAVGYYLTPQDPTLPFSVNCLTSHLLASTQVSC